MTLSLKQEQQLRQLQSVFLAENAHINLSAYRTEEQCWIGNILDSVAAGDILASLSSPPDVPLRVLDIGTGGGFPLLPLAILFPHIAFTGMDSTKKKIDAIGRIAENCGINNLTLLVGRAEELGHDSKYREQFDCVLARAVAPLATLLEFMSPFVRVGGAFLCWKSMNIEGEMHDSLEARMQLCARLEEHIAYDLPGDWGKRQILHFRKTEALPKKFPRAVGEPKKNPL